MINRLKPGRKFPMLLKAGSKFVMQLWHAGRASYPDFHGGKKPYVPSAIALKGETHVPPNGEKKAYVQPWELNIEEIPQLLEEFKTAAANALKMGPWGGDS